MDKFVWTVPATVLRVVDGDTIHLDLDLGWDVRITKNARILGIDAPEISTPEGVAAKAYAATLLNVGDTVVFTSHRLDKYGRPLGEIKYDNGDFATAMLSAGHAKVLTY